MNVYIQLISERIKIIDSVDHLGADISYTVPINAAEEIPELLEKFRDVRHYTIVNDAGDVLDEVGPVRIKSVALTPDYDAYVTVTMMDPKDLEIEELMRRIKEMEEKG